MAPAEGGLWFSSLTGNYVGFVNSKYSPPFSIAAETGAVSLSPGGKVSVTMKVTGTWTSSMGVNVSDSEGYSSVPVQIGVTPSVSEIPAASHSPYALDVEISARQSAAPGNYTAAVTLTEEGVQQTAYVFVDVA